MENIWILSTVTKLNICTNYHSQFPTLQKAGSFFSSVCHYSQTQFHIHTTTPKPACLQLSERNAIFRQDFVFRVIFVSGYHLQLCVHEGHKEGGQETKHDRMNGELNSSKGSEGSHEQVGSKETLKLNVTPELSFHKTSLGIFMFNPGDSSQKAGFRSCPVS